MIHYTCDICGKPIERVQPQRFEAEMMRGLNICLSASLRASPPQGTRREERDAWLTQAHIHVACALEALSAHVEGKTVPDKATWGFSVGRTEA